MGLKAKQVAGAIVTGLCIAAVVVAAMVAGATGAVVVVVVIFAAAFLTLAVYGAVKSRHVPLPWEVRR